MSELYEEMLARLEPLMQTNQRIGSTRALLILTKHIQQELEAGRLKHTLEVEQILRDIFKIREDILLDKFKEN